MCNAKQEFIEHTADLAVKCAEIYFYGEEDKPHLLRIGYSQEEYESFLEAINYDYNDGYGGQVLYGTIWYVGGTWSERGEYDGSEWWEYRKMPKIPKHLK